MISNFEQIQHHLVAGWVERESNKNIQGNLATYPGLLQPFKVETIAIAVNNCSKTVHLRCFKSLFQIQVIIIYVSIYVFPLHIFLVNVPV